MISFRIAVSVSSFGILAACGSGDSNSGGSAVGGGIGSGEVPTSAIVTLNMDGSLPDQNFAGTGASGRGSQFALINDTRSGYRFAYGLVAGSNEFLGVAGFAPTSAPGDQITTGAVSYAADYQLALIEDTRRNVSGEITLTATFIGQTVTGAADGLEVNGTFGGAAGTELDGTVTFDGVTANLDGVVGQDRIVGAFAGNTADSVLVGGFLGNADAP